MIPKIYVMITLNFTVLYILKIILRSFISTVLAAQGRFGNFKYHNNVVQSNLKTACQIYQMPYSKRD